MDKIAATVLSLSGVLFGAFLSLSILGFIIELNGWDKDYFKTSVESRIGWWLLSSSNEVLETMQSICRYGRIDIDPKYLLSSSSEIEIARSIIEKFQEQSKYLYFNIDATKKNATTPYYYFFMHYLNSFLDKKDDTCFDGNKMYIEKSRERCVNAGSYYSINYDVTNYGMVYNKLRYMARFYCEGIKNKINKTNIRYYSSDLIKKILDTQETTFWENIK